MFKLFITIDAMVQVDLTTYVVDEFDLLVEIEVHLTFGQLVIKFMTEVHVVENITKVRIGGRAKETNCTR